MSLRELLFHRFRTIGWLEPFVVATSVAATLNFGHILSQTIKAASSAGTRSLHGYEITTYYFGPPVSFYPRLFICSSLLIATFGILRSFPRSTAAMFGLIGALAGYFYWWIASYRLFRNFTDADVAFMNGSEIKQAGYLYQGTWLDIVVAAAVVVCSVLFLDRLVNRKHIVS